MKTGYVGLIGMPNAGKSTLMNYLVESKVSIVSSKPQTTRRRIQGIQTVYQENAQEKGEVLGQIVFVDAPGYLQGAKGLNRFLEQEALDIIQKSDALLGVLNLDEEKKETLELIVEKIKNSGRPRVFVITKADQMTLKKRITALLNLIGESETIFVTGGLSGTYDEQDQHAFLFQIGGKALTDDQEEFLMSRDRPVQIRERDKLNLALLNLLPESKQLLFEEDDLTTENLRDISAEIVREKCFEVLHHEIPYQLAVQVHKFDEGASPCPKLDFNIIVGKESHKKIVIGDKGSVIKEIGTRARKDIEKLLSSKVFIQLNVVVKEQWYENAQYMKELRYVIQD